MKKTIFLVFAALAFADTNADTLRELVALERQAMDGWMKGNPDPVLATCDPEVTYFHAVTDKRVEGLEALKALFETFRGKPLFESYEILNPKVQVAGEVAVLTYTFARSSGPVTDRWNATQVYRRTKQGWRVIHSHWSVIRQA